MPKRFIAYGLALIIMTATASYWLTHQPLPKLSEVKRPVITKQQPAETPSLPVFNKAQYSLTDSVSPWVVVNKKRPLNPKEYVPNDLVVPNVAKRSSDMQVRAVTVSALEAMFAAAAQAGSPLKLSSAYRSYGYQVNLYNGYVKKQGQAVADTQSARPGFSEHQTGLAVDLAPLDGRCNLERCFADTAAGKWLAANAHQYGFTISYPDGLTHITGYTYEPWHVRYIGTDLATEMRRLGVQTLEQFFDLGPAADY